MSSEASSGNSFKTVDVVDAAKQLALDMKESPQLIERDLLQKGEQLLSIYEDPNFSLSFQNMRELRKSCLEHGIEDVASGVMTLRSSTLGLTFRNGKLSSFVTPLGSSPQGTLVYSLGWKNIKAFKNWRNDQEGDVTQDEINLAIYKLSFELSKLL